MKNEMAELKFISTAFKKLCISMSEANYIQLFSILIPAPSMWSSFSYTFQTTSQFESILIAMSPVAQEWRKFVCTIFRSARTKMGFKGLRDIIQTKFCMALSRDTNVEPKLSSLFIYSMKALIRTRSCTGVEDAVKAITYSNFIWQD